MVRSYHEEVVSSGLNQQDNFGYLLLNGEEETVEKNENENEKKEGQEKEEEEKNEENEEKENDEIYEGGRDGWGLERWADSDYEGSYAGSYEEYKDSGYNVHNDAVEVCSPEHTPLLSLLYAHEESECFRLSTAWDLYLHNINVVLVYATTIQFVFVLY